MVAEVDGGEVTPPRARSGASGRRAASRASRGRRWSTCTATRRASIIPSAASAIAGRARRWREAMGDIGARSSKRSATSTAPDAVGVYIGNPTAFNVGLSIYAAGFLAALGTRNFFNAASLDCQNKFAVAEQMFGALRDPADPGSRPHRLLLVPRLESAGVADELRRHAARARAAQGDRGARRARRVRQPAAHRDGAGGGRAAVHPARHRRVLADGHAARHLRRGARGSRGLRARSPTSTSCARRRDRSRSTTSRRRPGSRSDTHRRAGALVRARAVGERLLLDGREHGLVRLAGVPRRAGAQRGHRQPRSRGRRAGAVARGAVRRSWRACSAGCARRGRAASATFRRSPSRCRPASSPTRS